MIFNPYNIHFNQPRIGELYERYMLFCDLDLIEKYFTAPAARSFFLDTSLVTLLLKGNSVSAVAELCGFNIVGKA